MKIKKLSIFCGIALVLALTVGPAYAVSLGFDVDQDGTVDDPAEITLYKSDTVAIDIYVVDWDSSDTYGNLAAVLIWFEWDTGSISLQDYSNTDPAWDYTDFDDSAPGELEMSHLNSGAGFPGPDVYVSTVVLHCIDAPSTSEIRVSIRDGNGVLMGITGMGFLEVADGEGIIYQLGCVRDEGCDDGLFCNGEETCDENEACQPGTNPCPGEACNEDTNSCESTPATTTTTTPPISQTTTTTAISQTTTTAISQTTTTTIISSTTTTTHSSTTTAISPPPCTAELLYGEDSEETELLRNLRDDILSKTKEGQETIKLYYQWSPTIVKAMEEDEKFKEEIKEIIDKILTLIRRELE